MSFGFGVSDVVLLSELAWNSYKSCKQAPDSFADISQDALALNAVLRELEETLRESPPLSISQQQRLKAVCDGPNAILNELLALVEKYESLATSSQRAWDRMRYAAENIADLRNRLISSTVLLTAFVATTPFVVEQKLRKLFKEIQSGKREPSVFSVQTIDSLSIEEQLAWRDIRKALEDVGITPTAFEQNKGFILDFLRNAMFSGAFQEGALAQPPTQTSVAQSDSSSKIKEGLQEWPLVSSLSPSKANPSLTYQTELPGPPPDVFKPKGRISSSNESNRFRRGMFDWLRCVRGLTSNVSLTNRLLWETISPESATGRSDKIDKHLVKEAQRLRNTKKFLLLGAGEAGKSTILQQLRIIYAGGLSCEERKPWRQILWANTILGFKITLEEMREHDPHVDYLNHTAASEAATAIESAEDISDDEDIPWYMLKHLHTLWCEPMFRRYLARGNEYAQFYNIAYCYENIHRIASSDSLPNNDIILHSRFRTSGITETSFHVAGKDLHVFDVGGARFERKKWVHSFENVSVVLFVVPLTGYDRCLVEDITGNAMLESLMLFESILSLPWFKKSDIILYFTQLDSLPDYSKSHPLNGPRTKFPEYKIGKHCPEEATNILLFFIHKFLSLNRSFRHIEVHAGDVTNTTLTTPCLRRIIERKSIWKEHSGLRRAMKDSEDQSKACCLASQLLWEKFALARKNGGEDK